ncbi:universal stress protein [Salinarchaeum laminariae]|uniref:universal stress protein n=1 Tax=Salinarchaeum laminariae TaxID=869888 RepID=UPI0020BE03D9|nr:universal stress protein [Salinarchaeum laminariae]
MHVLVGVEGSEESGRALEGVLERAADAGDELTVAVFALGEQSLDDVESSVREQLADAAVSWSIERITADHPASALVELAESGPYEQLAIGGGQQSPMGKIELGSTTEFVLLNAQLSVRLVR